VTVEKVNAEYQVFSTATRFHICAISKLTRTSWPGWEWKRSKDYIRDKIRSGKISDQVDPPAQQTISNIAHQIVFTAARVFDKGSSQLKR